MFSKTFTPKRVIAVDVFLESRKTSEFVGKLTFENRNYVFEYNLQYILSSQAIELGPELPKTRRYFKQGKLFASLEDRIPERRNPAYVDYCRVTGIDPGETNKLVLLSSIGSRGPSSFVFEAEFQKYTSLEAKKFRQKLGLSTRDFGHLMGVTQSSIVRLEKGQTTGREILKIIELVENCPRAFEYFFVKNKKYLHSKSQEKVFKILRADIKKIENR